jgi:hypothetical protein
MGLASTPVRRRKVTVDPAMIARAEAALGRLSSQFGAWIREEVERLDAAGALARERGLSGVSGERLNNQAHEVKGLAATCGYPLVTHIAGSLCRLIEDPQTRSNAPPFLIDAHIAAIGAALRDNIRDAAHPTGQALIDELQLRVREVR